jgi:hypothetical protein
MLLVRINNGLPGLLAPVPLDESFETDSNCVGARGCHTIVNESIDSG